MSSPRIEHVNVTVSDPRRTAALMQQLFGWRVRWQGPVRDGGYSIHVGSDAQYLALYGAAASGAGAAAPADAPVDTALNHIGVEVDDLDATEARVLDAGLRTYSHGHYEPGRRFYFLDPDAIEYEVISYRA